MPAKRYPILHVLEAPTAELEWHGVIDSARGTLPLEAHTAMAEQGRRITALAMDRPALVHVTLKGRAIRLHVRWPAGGEPPTEFMLRVTGDAVTSPPPWAPHSRREYQANKRAFERAAPAPTRPINPINPINP